MTAIAKNLFLKLKLQLYLFQILNLTSYFLISWDPQFDTILQVVRYLVHIIFYNRYQVLLYQCRITTLLKQEIAEIRPKVVEEATTMS